MSKKSRGFIRYKSYLFVSKDPIIDAMRGPVSESKMSYSQIQQEGGPSAATLRNWFHGNTRRPQFATVAATTRTLGKSGIRFGSTGPKLVD